MNTLALSLAHTNRCDANKEKNSPSSLVSAQHSAKMCPSSEFGGGDTQRTASLTIQPRQGS